MARRIGLVVLRVFGALLLVLALATAIGLALTVGRRPPRTDVSETLFQGVTYTRRARSSPRPLMIHALRIDVTAPGIRFLVTPGDTSKGMDARAATTTEFARRYGVQLAVNGSFFTPISGVDYLPDSYYPHSGDPVDITGLSVSDGQSYSPDQAGHAKLCLMPGRASITDGLCPDDARNVLAGDLIIARNGQPATMAPQQVVHPHTAAGVDAAGLTLWLIVVDGRQPDYSEGMTLPELAELALELGADTVLNLDGGGSSAMVVGEENGPRLLNAPIHTRIPMRERPVGNHLGVFALP